jgi:hypothetical protein
VVMVSGLRLRVILSDCMFTYAGSVDLFQIIYLFCPHGSGFVSSEFSHRDPANRKVENKQVNMAGARSKNTLISGARGEVE